MNNGKQRSKYQEKRLAKVLDGDLVPYSGAGKLKGDILTDQWFIEAKSSALVAKDGAKSIYIQLPWLKKMESQRLAMNKPYAALAVHFKSENKDWYLISEEMMLNIMARLKE